MRLTGTDQVYGRYDQFNGDPVFGYDVRAFNVGYLRKIGPYSRIGVDYQFKNRVDRERRQPEQPAPRELERREIAAMQARKKERPMRSWTKALLALVVVWAVGVTAATQTSRGPRPPTRQAGQFRGQVVSASGAMAVGGPATNPGHPVANATVYLVPVAAIDTTTRITASAIYARSVPG